MLIMAFGLIGLHGYIKEVFNFKLGTLDGTNWLRPTVMLWLKGTQRWLNIQDKAYRVQGY